MLDNIAINFKFVHLKHITNKMYAIPIPLNIYCTDNELASSTLESFWGVIHPYKINSGKERNFLVQFNSMAMIL